MHRFATAVALLFAVPFAAFAQAPHEAWRTVETEHYRVHYPATHEAWARRSASRLESIRTRVGGAVGFAPGAVVDVIVSDPVSQPNGIAWPILGWPRMILFTSPPAPESVIGNYDDWFELLAVHEQTHLAHLLRPSRNPLRRLGALVLPVGPIALVAPRWVSEGYATVIEGELTGRGRPNSALQAAILRRWAQLGRLPTYGQLNSDSRNWLGMSMAYLAGSAYLDWLQQRGGPDSLQKLWRRMSARADRSFDDAFTGVFGDSPQKLYARYTAELTARAMESERAIESMRNDGELWQDLSWTTEVPAVTHDGSKLVTVLRDRQRPSRLVVYATAPPAEEEKKWSERIDELLKRDPEDVAPIRTKPLARKPLHELETRDGAEPYGPRWLPDGSILFVRFEPDAEGFLRPDLFRWFPERRRVERVTEGASVRDAWPSRDGTWAAAVRNVHGLSQLVRIDLATGAVAPLTDAVVDRVYDSPVIHPNGKRLAYVVHREGEWRLVIRDLATGSEIEPPLGGATVVAHPAWSASGEELFAVLDWNERLEIHSIDLEGHALPRRITQSHGASVAPAPAPDGSIYFLALDADGFDIRRLASAAALPESDVVATRPARRAPFAAAAIAPSTDYRFGRQELAILFGGNYAPSARNSEIGIRAGDVIGRTSAFGVASLAGDRGVSGGAIAAAWRGWPVAIAAHGYAAEEKLATGDRDRHGIELRATWDRAWRAGGVEIAGGALVEKRGDASRRFGFLDGAVAHRRTFGLWALRYRAAAHVDRGTTEGEPWTRAGGSLTAAIERQEQWLEFSIRRRHADASPAEELLSLGGIRSTVLPESALSERELVAALPAELLRGDRSESQRIATRLAIAPVTFFFERHRLWTSGGLRAPWLALAGAEVAFATGPQPILRLPAAEIRAGGARILDEPLHGRSEWWIGLAWRP